MTKNTIKFATNFQTLDKKLKVAFNMIPTLKELHAMEAHWDTAATRMLKKNKCDLEDIREVSIEKGKTLADEESLFFMETSALDSTNVHTAFEVVIREIYNNVSRKVLNSDSYKVELTINLVSLNANSTEQSTFC